MRKDSNKKIAALALVAALTNAVAMPFAQAGEIYEFYTGARQLGMGGAYTGVVNDETALLTNPAGLGKVRDVIITVADPELHGSFNNTEITKLETLTKSFNANDLVGLLKEHPGKHWHAKLQAFPSIVAPNVGFGIHAKSSYDASVSDDGSIYRLDYTNDYAAALGFCFRLFSGILKVGVTGRYVNRVEVHKDLDPNTSVDMNAVASEGSGFAGDIGMIATAPVAWLPSVSAVLRDVGDTSYTLTSGMFYKTQSRPAETKQTMDAGISAFPILSNQTRMTLTAEMHDVFNVRGESDMMKRVHTGMELNFHDFFFLRAGMNQRYWTAGVELATERFQLQAASYGEELGDENANKEDRRWVGKISIRF